MKHYMTPAISVMAISTVCMQAVSSAYTPGTMNVNTLEFDIVHTISGDVD